MKVICKLGDFLKGANKIHRGFNAVKLAIAFSEVKAIRPGRQPHFAATSFAYPEDSPWTNSVIHLAAYHSNSLFSSQFVHDGSEHLIVKSRLSIFAGSDI